MSKPDHDTLRALRIVHTGGMTKAESNRAHTRTRAMQRFGLDLKRRDLDAITSFILSGQAIEIARQDKNTSHWHMNVGGHDVVVVFDLVTSTPVTMLTPEMSARSLAVKGEHHVPERDEVDDE